MSRRDRMIRAAELCRAASDSLIIASCGVTPARRQALTINAEAALYEALDLMWLADGETQPQTLEIAA